MSDPKVSPACQRVLDTWATRGVEVRAMAIRGEPFWTTTEVTECQALLSATERSLGLSS